MVTHRQWVTIACFLVKIIPGAIHGDDCHWAGILRNSGAPDCILKPAFPDVTLTGIEEEGSGKSFVWSLKTAFFLQTERHDDILISRCIYLHI